MKKLFNLSLLLLVSILAHSQNNLEEVVYLKNGSIIRGTIIEQIPNETLKIQTKDGNIFVYKFDEIVKTTKEAIVNPVINNSYVVNTSSISSGFLDATIVNEVSSENDDNILIQVTHNILDVNGKLLIKEGTPIQCNIEKTKRKGVGKPGSIVITMNSVKSVDGQDIRLNGKHSKEGKNMKGKALGVGLGVGLGTLLVPMLAYMAKKGGPAIIGANTVVSNVAILGTYQIK
jgi:hypothetical protein